MKTFYIYTTDNNLIFNCEAVSRMAAATEFAQKRNSSVVNFKDQDAFADGTATPESRSWFEINGRTTLYKVTETLLDA